MNKTIKTLSILGLLIAGVSCETSKEGFSAAYQDAASKPGSGVTSEGQVALDRLTNGGRTLPSSTALTRGIQVGDIPEGGDCPRCSPPVVSSSGSTGGSCKHFNKFVSAGVPADALKQALTFYDKNKSSFKNQRYISIADYSVRSDKKRFFKLDMSTGNVQKEKVSHGSGSAGGKKWGDQNHDGYVDRCRIPSGKSGGKHNQFGMTRAGFFKTSSFYNSSSHDKGSGSGWPRLFSSPPKNGMKMHGLTPGVNDQAMAHGVVMHEAYYNQASIMGRSFGCPAFAPGKGKALMSDITGGSLYYSYVPINEATCKNDMNKVRAQVPNWKNKCK
jgi:hypothetical protein